MKTMLKVLCLALAVGMLADIMAARAPMKPAGAPQPAAGPALAPKITEGTLNALGKDGKPLGPCPLQHTDVQASVAGHIAYVMVTQVFANPYQDKIEAVYTFPLGAEAAVTDMTMKVGNRIIRGLIKPREEAKEIYEQAKAAGHVASLLDQERPNIFTQSVANIEPGNKVEIQISYTETLKYEDGVYSFVFPMVVGPRYIPGGETGKPGPGLVPLLKGAGGTDKVPDADRITPPITPEGTRAGHDISVKVYVNAGMEIKSLTSRQHEIKTDWKNPEHTRAIVELASKDTIPNKDFVLEFSTASDRIEDAALTTTDRRGGYFMLVLQPPKKVQPKQILPREIIFVIDVSGSQMGFPLDISKKVMEQAIADLRDGDTFNLLTFANGTRFCWDSPVPSTKENRQKAQEFLKDLKGGGGTEMMKAIDASLGGVHDKDKLRLVAFFTDGYVGNDMAIIDTVQKNAGTSRVFSFGIGSSVNRYLLDNMARAGRGEVEYVLNPDMGEKAAKRFYERINAPVLTDISIDWGELGKLVKAEELFPSAVPDLFAVKPLVLTGMYKTDKDVTGEITIRGKTGEGPFERKVKVTLPASETANAVIAPMWARAKVESLMNKDLMGAQRGSPDPAIKEQVVGLGIAYHLLTQYTSFVAVEEKTVTIGGQPRTVAVPVEMPEGVSYEGIFGEGGGRMQGGFGGGGRGGAGGMMLLSRAAAKPASSSGYALASLADGPAESSALAHGDVKSREGRIKEDKNLSEAERRTKVAELKLIKELQGLAAKLDKDGNYKSDKLTVKDGKIEITVYLYELNDKTLEDLTKLGFVKILDASAVKMVIGTIEVKKLEDLAWLEVVRRIDLPSFSK
jgi:Ca-activated chloride channel family protein